MQDLIWLAGAGLLYLAAHGLTVAYDALLHRGAP